jgi:NAD(P)-dependent dehydrogenase (short-subunit alcohol dehydrogenase family)
MTGAKVAAGKIAFVTGGARGIGFVSARAPGWLDIDAFARLRTHKLRPQRSGFLWSRR